MTTYEKSQALSDAGIKFPESKEVYLFSNLNDSWELTYRSIHRVKVELKHHPEFVCDAPSMEDLLNKLPSDIVINKIRRDLTVIKGRVNIEVKYDDGYDIIEGSSFMSSNTNPCNALADLLLWCKSKGHLNN